jgi:hypothetical protein
VTYVKTYGNVISGTTHQKTVAPEDVKATSDGGYILLATTDCLTQACVSAQGGTNNLVSWLVKTDFSGNPQWQKEAGCFTSPPGDYSIGVSLVQTTDGGYVKPRAKTIADAMAPCEIPRMCNMQSPLVEFGIVTSAETRLGAASSRRPATQQGGRGPVCPLVALSTSCPNARSCLSRGSPRYIPSAKTPRKREKPRSKCTSITAPMN